MKILKISFLIVLFLSCAKNRDKILPTKLALTESVYSSILVQPDSLYEVYAVVSGILDENLVSEGDVIQKDQQIAQIINSSPKLKSDNARLSLKLAQENLVGRAALLKSLTDEISTAQLKYTNDSINYQRQKNLWEQNIGSKTQYDAKKLNFELAKKNLNLSVQKYRRTKNELQTTVKQAQNNFESSLINTKDFRVKSKINGKVYALYKEPGEMVNSTEPIASIGSTSEYVINMLVDEEDIVRISLNQEVILNLEAYQNQLFQGIVSKIYPKKDNRNQTFKVEARFIKAPEILYPGLSGEANIIIAKKKDVLAIPKEYLIDGKTVETEDGVVEIITGLQNLEYIEVLEGITAQTYIYKPTE